MQYKYVQLDADIIIIIIIRGLSGTQNKMIRVLCGTPDNVHSLPSTEEDL